MPTCVHEDKSCTLQEKRNQTRYSSRKYYNIVFFVVRTSNPFFHPHHSNPCCKSLSSSEESETLESQNYKIRPKDEKIMSRGASLVSFFRLSRDVGFVAKPLRCGTRIVFQDCSLAFGTRGDPRLLLYNFHCFMWWVPLSCYINSKEKHLTYATNFNVLISSQTRRPQPLREKIHS
jgi:hypothetical protein